MVKVSGTVVDGSRFRVQGLGLVICITKSLIKIRSRIVRRWWFKFWTPDVLREIKEMCGVTGEEKDEEEVEERYGDRISSSSVTREKGGRLSVKS